MFTCCEDLLYIYYIFYLIYILFENIKKLNQSRITINQLSNYYVKIYFTLSMWIKVELRVKYNNLT